MSSFVRAAILFSVFGLALGCKPAGPPVVHVHGKITLGDKPVPAGIVIFQSEDGLVNVTGNLDEQGHYEMRTYDKVGIPPGKYKVTLARPAPPGDTPPLAGDALKETLVDKTIPDKYLDAKTSDLTADVTLEKSEFDFKLTP